MPVLFRILLLALICATWPIDVQASLYAFVPSDSQYRVDVVDEVVLCPGRKCQGHAFGPQAKVRDTSFLNRAKAQLTCGVARFGSVTSQAAGSET